MVDAIISDLNTKATIDRSEFLAIEDIDETYKILISQISELDFNSDEKNYIDLNTAHRTSDGKDHSDVVSNNAHRISTSNPHNVTKTQVGLSSVDNVQQIPLTQKGVANGVATLGSGGQIPSSQLPAGTQTLKGTFGSVGSTTGGDLPISGNLNGDTYTCDTNGFVSAQSGFTFDINDQAQYTDAGWIKLDNTDAIISVNGKTGIVVIDKTDIGLSSVTNDAQIKKISSSTDSKIPQWDGTTGDLLKDGLSIETTISDVDTAIPSSGAVVDLVATKADKNPAINTQTGTSYEFVLADDGKIVEGNNASPITFTVPPNSSVAFPVGTQIEGVQYGAGQITIAEGAGVTVNSADSLLSTRVQFSGLSLYKRATDEWQLVGDLA